MTSSLCDAETASKTSKTWQESFSELQSLLLAASSSSNNNNNNNNAAGNRDSHLQIAKICTKIILDSDNDAPASALSVVRTIYLRALIHLGEFSKVVDEFHNNINNKNANSNTEEVAYALYRLRKYDACRKLIVSSPSYNNDTAVNKDDEEDKSSGKSSSSSSDMLMMHIHAQTLYRLGETNQADELYSKILCGDGQDYDTTMDVDEREDTLSNALANRIANYSPGSMLQDDGTSLTSWLEQDESIRQLIQLYGLGGGEGGIKEKVDDYIDDNEENMLQNYDLAYNLATYLLVSSDARSLSHVIQAKHLLEHAEKSALTILDSPSPTEEVDDEEENDNAVPALVVDDADDDDQKQKLVLLAEREAGPIRANLALAKILLGGEENEMDALRTYLTLFTKAAKSTEEEQGNLLATVSNNLAVLRDGKDSAVDVLKRVPITSSLFMSEDGVRDSNNNGGKKKKKETGGGAVVSSVPLIDATPQQVRTALLNRALLLAKMGNIAACSEALQGLRASLLISYNGDNSSANKSPVAKRGKGKTKTLASSEEDGVPTARPSSDAEIDAWKAQADLVESELVRITESKEKNPSDVLDGAIANLDKAIDTRENDKALGVLTCTKSQLLLHKAVLANRDMTAVGFIDALESLPSSVKSCPGTKVTLASLYGSTTNDRKAEQLLSDIGNGIALAEFHLERGQYQKAVGLLEGISDEQGSDTPMEVRAMLVKALSYTDPEQAEELARSLLLDATPMELDGEQLELMDIPRFSKKAGDGSRKSIAATAGNGRIRLGDHNKKNRDAILRKRAKQREAYLSKLESEGRYDPKQSPKPDPERWIPKSQRSYNRRGRRGRNKGTGAQGGGAGAGMEKDAAKLDVAARSAANDLSSGGGPSTANIKVSSSSGARKGKGGKRR